MPEPLTTLVVGGYLLGKAADVLVNVLGARLDRSRLLGSLLDPRTNHDVGHALRRAWDRACGDVADAFRQSFYYRRLDEQAQSLLADWLEDIRSPECVERLFPLSESQPEAMTPLSADDLYLADPDAVNRTILAILQQRGPYPSLPPVFRRWIEQEKRLLNGLTFHFVEELKRDARARDGFFFQQFIALRRAIESRASAPPAPPDALREEWDRLLPRLETLLEAIEGYRAFQEWAKEMLTHISYVAEDTRGMVEEIHGAVVGGSVTAWNPEEHLLNPPGVEFCFGRDAEIRALVAALLAEPPPRLPVTGDGGMGKTTLACAALNHPDVVRRYGRRRFWVPCETVSDREALAARGAAAAGLPPGPDAEARLRHRLEEAPAVLALDNFETPLDADPAGAEAFLRDVAATPGLALLLTKRGFARPGSLAWRDLPSLEPVNMATARDIFCALAGERLRADPRLDALLEAVGRSPLAVDLLARRAQGERDLAGVQRAWERAHTAMLRVEGADDKLLNLHASINMSLDSPRMTPPARRLLALLARLPAGIARDDLDRLLPDEGEAAARCMRERGLAHEDAAARLQMQPTVRAYLSEFRPDLLDPADMDRAAVHYTGLARTQGALVGTTQGAGAVRRLTPEAANLEAMLIHAAAAAYAWSVVEAAWGLAEFSRFTGLIGGNAIRRAAEAARESGDLLGQANCIRSLGDIALDRSDHDTARALYEQAQPLFRRIKEPYSIGGAHRRLARIAPDAAARRRHVRAARTAWRSIGFDHLVQELDAEFGPPGEDD